jgi:hypothetical protein
VFRLFLFAALPLLFAACASTPKFDAQPSEPVDLQGRWVLDVERSDDAEAAVMQAFGRKRARSGDKAPAKPPSPEQVAGPVAPTESGSTAGTGDIEPRKLISNPDWLEVEQGSDLIVINMGGKEFRRYAMGGELSWVGRAGPFKTWSGWKKTTMIAVSKSPTKIKVTERYLVSTDGSLTRRVKLETDQLDDPVQFRQIFTRAAE